MKKEEAVKLTRKVTVRFKEAEYNHLYGRFKNTTKRKFSDYLRSILLDKKITVYTRNRSLDDLVTELIELRSELSAAENTFGQAVKKLHTMEAVPDIKGWLFLNENTRQKFLQKVAEIKEKIDQISDQWLHE